MTIIDKRAYPEDHEAEALRMFRYAEANGIKIEGTPLFNERVKAALDREKRNRVGIEKLAKKHEIQII